MESTTWKDLPNDEIKTCLGSFFFFSPFALDNIDDYCRGWKITDVFNINQTGIKTDRDSLFFDFDKETLKSRIEHFYSEEGIAADFKEAYGVKNSPSYDLLGKRKTSSFDANNLRLCLYRPFDLRYLYYSPEITSRPASNVTQHMLHGNNLSLLAKRQSKREPFSYIFCTNLIAESTVFESAYANNNLFPLYVLPIEGNLQDPLLDESSWTPSVDGRIPNLNSNFIDHFANLLKLEFISDGRGDLQKTFGPEDVFHYTYAIFHSPTYRERYAKFLKIDFPRLPLTSDSKLFVSLASLGEELVSLHLLESRQLAKAITRFPEGGDNVVAASHPRYLAPGEAEPGSGETLKEGRVYINAKQYFEGIPPEIWEFQIGGYQVCKKWLKDRKGRELSFDDIEHYQKIIVALNETIRLMQEIDKAIPSWPIE